MKYPVLLAFALTSLAFGGCSDSEDGDPALSPSPLAPPDLGGWDGTAALSPTSAPLPTMLSALDATYYPDIACGPHPENLVDFVMPNMPGGTPPLLVYIHGGGFNGGSRLNAFTSSGLAADAVAYVEAGFAYATIDYRFLDANGVKTSLQDSQVCLQSLRYHAAELGFDPDHIVLAGGSAGAGTSLWLATIDDLAEPMNDHPILRESTRVDGSLIYGTQATYDVLRWDPDVFSPEYAGIQNLIINLGFEPALLAFYGVATTEELEEPYYVDYRLSVDMLAWMSPDDPPIWISTGGDAGFPTTQGAVLHHPFHARAVMEYAEAQGIEVVPTIPALDLTATESNVEFALRVVSLP